MDGEYPKQKTQKNNKKAYCDNISYISNFLQPSWFRCPICADNEMDRVILAYGQYILCPITIVLWGILLFVSLN